MWNAFANSVGLGGGDQTPIDLPSTYPFTAPATPEDRIQLAHGQHYKDYLRVLDADCWVLLDVADREAKEGGDMKLWSRPQEGSYHFIKATFTIPGVGPKELFDLIANEDVKERQKFGPNMEELVFFDKPDENTAMIYTKYYAPPPVAGRDFVFLQGRKTHDDDGTMEVWGSSVACDDKYPEGVSGGSYVRGSCFWGWRGRKAGDNVLVEYFNVSDPRGWCPGWIFSYLKTQASSDLCGVRDVLRGKGVNTHKVELEECGITTDDVKEAEAHKTDGTIAAAN
eukprot:PhM_4_TR13347/c0_g1_i1/m.69143